MTSDAELWLSMAAHGCSSFNPYPQLLVGLSRGAPSYLDLKKKGMVQGRRWISMEVLFSSRSPIINSNLMTPCKTEVFALKAQEGHRATEMPSNHPWLMGGGGQNLFSVVSLGLLGKHQQWK